MSKQSRDFQKGYIIGQNLGKEPQEPQKSQKSQNSSSSFGPVTWVVLVAFIIAIILSR